MLKIEAEMKLYRTAFISLHDLLTTSAYMHLDAFCVTCEPGLTEFSNIEAPLLLPRSCQIHLILAAL